MAIGLGSTQLSQHQVPVLWGIEDSRVADQAARVNPHCEQLLETDRDLGRGLARCGSVCDLSDGHGPL